MNILLFLGMNSKNSLAELLASEGMPSPLAKQA
jgi:hypothetical protein